MEHMGMIDKPVRKAGEPYTAFMYRVHLYKVQCRESALAQIRAIDKANARSNKGAIAKPIATRETERERISLFDKAERNPLLASMLRRMQKDGVKI
jgi:hypothetical protein